MEIRAVTTADEEIFCALTEQMYQTDAVGHPLAAGRAAATFQQALQGQMVRIFLMEADGQVVGYGIVVDTWNNEYGKTLYLDELFFTADCRGRGYGRQYLAWLDQLAAAEGYDALLLYVSPANNAAARLYQRLGFDFDEYKTMVKKC